MRMFFFKTETTILYSLMLTTVQVRADVEQTCSKRDIVEDKKLVGFSYREETGLNRQQCGKECLASSSCRSVNFNKQDFVCEINSIDDTTVLSNEPLWEYISRTDFTKILPDPCQQAGCINHHQCIVLRSGVPKCLLTECDFPPDVPNALRTSPPLTSVGKSATYTCATNYRLKSGTGKLMCLPSGMYTNINFECEIQCRNPPVVTNANAITNNVVNVGETITYTCATNYRLTGGSGIIQCLTSGVFSDADFSCQLIQCPNPPIMKSSSSHKDVNCLNVGCNAYYTCSNGTYANTMFAYLRCLSDGVWTTSLTYHGCT